MSEPTPDPKPDDKPPAPEPKPNEPAPPNSPGPDPKPETDWKAEARKWEERAKANKDAAAKLAEIEAANQTEAEKAAARAEAAEKRAQELTDRTVRAEVRSLAKGRLVDPDDAPRFLDLKAFVDDDGNVDEAAITKAIDDLVEKKPHLAESDSRRFKGSADGGHREGASRPAQLSRADLAGMTPRQIKTAKDEGRLADLLGTK
jgi:thioesterase domain-containing protein